MRWRVRVVAPIVAAVLGIGGGVVTALVVTGDDTDPATPSFEDPLHLGIPLVDLECTGEAILVVGRGDSIAPLTNAVADNQELRPHYLRSSGSCDTIFGSEDGERPAYAVYLGPYETLTAPCETRMTPEHRADVVTILRSGNQTLVKCACVLPSSAAPELRLSMVTTPEDVVWIRALQGMLNDYDPKLFPRERVTGEYDEATAARVTDVQREAPGVLTEPGVVDAITWRVLTDRICRIYDY